MPYRADIPPYCRDERGMQAPDAQAGTIGSALRSDDVERFRGEQIVEAGAGGAPESRTAGSSDQPKRAVGDGSSGVGCGGLIQARGMGVRVIVAEDFWTAGACGAMSGDKGGGIDLEMARRIGGDIRGRKNGADMLILTQQKTADFRGFGSSQREDSIQQRP